MKIVDGFVDGFIGRQIHGWAVELPDRDRCIVEVRDHRGERLGQGRPNRPRADLAILAYERVDLGFLVTIDRYGDGRFLGVFVGEVELPGSPLPIGPDVFDGHFEIIRGMAIGWVARRSDDRTSPIITLTFADGSILAEAVAIYDDVEGDVVFSPARFTIELPPRCLVLEEFIVFAHADGTRFGRATGRLGLDGYLDHVSAECVEGWLIAPNAPGRQLVVNAWRDGERVGRAICDQPRADLRGRYPDSWKIGFRLPLRRTEPRIAVISSLTLRLEDGEHDILGSPFVVGHRIAFIANAKRVAYAIQGPVGGLTSGERALFQDMLSQYIAARRNGSDYLHVRSVLDVLDDPAPRITVLIPVYKGVQLTEICIRSALAEIGPRDRLLIVADCPPEPKMTLMLSSFRQIDSITILTNETNLGFVGSVNRGLSFCKSGDVLLLNSDTRLFPGCIDQLHTVMAQSDDIATVTPMSNNATIFSYPHPRLARVTLDDCDWSQLAATALESNHDRSVTVPTGHGFCMLVKRAVLDRIGKMNETFGRGYGEENEFCLRAADLGYRHLAAIGAFVEHRESVSFGEEKANLISTNLSKLEALYPEYTANIMEFERDDPLRVARWTLDAYRLRRTVLSGSRFVLSVINSLPGGTGKAARDISRIVGYDGRLELLMTIRDDGLIWVESRELCLRAVFRDGEVNHLIELLDEADIQLVVFHQLLGLSDKTIAVLGRWASRRRAVYYTHDFYSICPRVTMIDAVGRFCNAAAAEVCRRCIAISGSHEMSTLTHIDPANHRKLFADFFANMTALVTPSRDTASYISRIFEHKRIIPIPHVEPADLYPSEMRRGDSNRIVLVGSLGPHKGSRRLKEIAMEAFMLYPDLIFTVIGHTDIDHQLADLPNVEITGPYKPEELPSIIRTTNPRAALFLSGWPETFSYTLSEVVSHGVLPIVPNLGALAERVKKAGFGIVFPFPIDAQQVLDVLGSLRDPKKVYSSRPNAFYMPQSIEMIDSLLNGPDNSLDLLPLAI